MLFSQQGGAGRGKERERAETQEKIDESIQGKAADFKSMCFKGAW
jgi:hypothetical protein